MSKVITDPEQANESRARSRFTREQELDDVRAVISTPEGRRFILRLLSECRVSQSVWHPSAAIHKYAGIQEVGHFIFSEVVSADPATGAKMLVEAYQSEIQKPKGDR